MTGLRFGIRFSFIILGLTILVAGCVSGVRFPSANPGRPSRPLTVSASLYRPQGPGPFPAMVVLHGCDGPTSHTIDWAQWFMAEGYVALAVDSFSPRGVSDDCDTGGTSAERVWDAFGALAYLRSLPFVEKDRIGVIGWSHGGIVALRASRDLLARYTLNARGFRVAVAFYPMCGGNLSSDTTIPILLLLGEDDDWSPTVPCVQIARELKEGSRPIEWTVYPGATHAFDARSIRGTVIFRGHILTYDRRATADAEKRIRDFLTRYLQ